MITENQLSILIRTLILTGLTDYGYSGIPVKQSYQPTQEGANTTPTIYFFKIADKRYGFLGREDIYNSLTTEMDHSESQYYETTYQINAFSIQNPNDPSSLTASDLVNIASDILQSDKTVKTLNDQGMGILRIQDIKNPRFVDDSNRFEESPSFDFILTYQQTRISVNPKVNGFTSGIFPI